MIFQIRNLCHHLFINSQTTGSINDNDIVTLSLSFLQSMVCNRKNIFILWFTINRHTNRLTNNLQLINSCRTIYVTSNEQRILMLLCLKQISQFTTECRFTTSLQTTHQNNSRTTFKFHRYRLTTHELCQFIVYKLNQHLTRTDSCQNILA